jgi:putative ABC transport system permease protein
VSQWLALFSRLILRPLRNELLRTGLTVLSVAMGVAVVVAIDLAGTAAAGSFHSSLESLTSKAEIEISATGGLDEQLLGKLVQLPEALRFTPRIEDFASINGTGEALPFIGLDLVGSDVVGRDSVEEGPPENAALDLLGAGNPIWVGPRLGLHKGDHVQLLINDQTHEFTVRGVLKPSTARVGEENVIVADIDLAQTVTGKMGRLDSISVTTPEGPRDISQWIKYLRKTLPPSVSIEPVGSRTDENRKMLAGFRWNLRVLSYIALVVGAFLIYNTISVSVVRRRAETGIARALGATRGLVLGAFLAEAAVFAIVGSAAGLVLGRLLALGAVRLLGSTVQALYVSSQPSAVAFTLSALLKALSAGVGISLLAALAPAYEASRVTPFEAMSRGKEEYATRRRSRWSLPLAFGLAMLAAIAAQAPAIGRQPIFGYVAAVFLIASATLATPGLLDLFVSGIAGPLTKLGQVEALVAVRSLRASLRRTSVLIAALATAVAMMASVAIMVGSFRETVTVWMENQLQADLYLRAAGSAAADRHPTMDVIIADEIERLPGVDTVDRFRAYAISYEGLPASLGGGETSKVRSRTSTRLLAGKKLDESLDDLSKGDTVLISEPFANKHHLKVGDDLQLNLGGQQPRFRVAGVYYDYSTERGFVVMDRKTLLRYLPDRAISNMAVYLKPGANAEDVRRQIDKVIGGRGVLVFTNARLRKEAIAIFDRTFSITWALEAVAIVVAVMGVAGALLALVIDRRREFGLLRFLGASGGQVRRIIVAEAAFVGLLANAVGLALGTALSLVLIYVINKQSFGWTIQFHWPGALLGSALVGVYLATIIASLYPARTAMRLNPIEVVHED